MACKRLEETTFVWPTIRGGVMTLNRAQFEAPFSGLDWRKVRAREAQASAAAELIARANWRAVPVGSGYPCPMPAAARMDLSAIPEDQRDAVAALLRENSDLKGETASLKEIVQRLEHLVAELTHVVHGKKSEKLSKDARQLAFEDLETAVAAVEKQQDSRPTSDDASRRQTPRARRNRGSFPESLPRIEQAIERDSLMCPCGCGSPLSLEPMARQRRPHKIGVVPQARLRRDDRTERLDVVPAQLRVILTIRLKYACRVCTDGVKQTPMPPWLIEGGLPTEGAIAHVLVSKYADHLPLFRQSQILARSGIDIHRFTLADWGEDRS